MMIFILYYLYFFRSHTCITFELLSINLYELIKKNKFQGFSLQLVRKFAHSLLQCLDTLYRNKIIHCDMKPENVLLKQQGRSGIKVGSLLSLYYFLSKRKPPKIDKRCVLLCPKIINSIQMIIFSTKIIWVYVFCQKKYLKK